MKHIGIIGSRRRATQADYSLLFHAFLKLYEPGDCIISGGCPTGGDAFAERIAKALGIPITIIYPPKHLIDKDLQRVNPRAAFAKIAYTRNEWIAQESDVILALVAPDRTGGTEDTLKHAKRLGKATQVLT